MEINGTSAATLVSSSPVEDEAKNKRLVGHM